MLRQFRFNGFGCVNFRVHVIRVTRNWERNFAFKAKWKSHSQHKSSSIKNWNADHFSLELELRRSPEEFWVSMKNQVTDFRSCSAARMTSLHQFLSQTWLLFHFLISYSGRVFQTEISKLVILFDSGLVGFQKRLHLHTSIFDLLLRAYFVSNHEGNNFLKL